MLAATYDEHKALLVALINNTSIITHWHEERDQDRGLRIMRLKGIPADEAVDVLMLHLNDGIVKRGNIVEIVNEMASYTQDGLWGYVKAPEATLAAMALILPNPASNRRCVDLKLVMALSQEHVLRTADIIRHRYGINALLSF